MRGVRVRVQLQRELMRLAQIDRNEKSESEVLRLRKQKVLSLDLLLETAKCVHLTAFVRAYLHLAASVLAYLHLTASGGPGIFTPRCLRTGIFTPHCLWRTWHIYTSLPLDLAYLQLR